MPFVILALTLGLVRYRLGRTEAADKSAAQAEAAQKEASREAKARAAMVPMVVPVSLSLGQELADEILGESREGPLLTEAVPQLRDALFVELGLALPAVQAHVASGLSPRQYAVSIQEIPAEHGEIPEAALLYVGDLADLERKLKRPVRTIDAETPEFVAKAADSVHWLAASQQAALDDAGISYAKAEAVVARHLRYVLGRQAGALVGLQEVQSMLDLLERSHPALVRNVVPKPVPLALLADVLKRLAEESISIRPLREILEALAIFAPNERDPVALTELVRAQLRQQITHRFAQGGQLPVYLLDPEIEDAVRDSVQHTASGSYLALPPDQAKDIITAVQNTMRDHVGNGAKLLLTQADVRRYLRRLIQVDVPDCQVLSYQELSPQASVQPLGRVGI